MKTHSTATELTLPERSSALRRFGYTPEEAAFFAFAALAGAYFLRRHVAAFLGKRDGGVVTQLVHKILTLDHARCSTWAKGVNLYHLGSRPLFEALGEPDNRNRRRHELAQIKNRLMCLDVLLEHPSARILATERDRLEYFDGLGIARDLLPQKTFRARLGGRSTTRYFVERQPLFVDVKPASGASIPAFVFVDEGLVTASRFQRFLAEHTRLFNALEALTLVYAADSSRHFARAAAIAAHVLDANHNSSLPLDSPLDDALLAYFQLRKRFEDRALASFDREQLLQLRDARSRFSGPDIEGNYQLWLAGEALGATELSPLAASRDIARSKRFASQLLPHDYAIFEHVLPR